MPVSLRQKSVSEKNKHSDQQTLAKKTANCSWILYISCLQWIIRQKLKVNKVIQISLSISLSHSLRHTETSLHVAQHFSFFTTVFIMCSSDECILNTIENSRISTSSTHKSVVVSPIWLALSILHLLNAMIYNHSSRKYKYNVCHAWSSTTGIQ